MKTKWLMLCGVLASILYVATVIIGGILRPDYSHFTEPISELTAAGAPNKPLLDGLFLTYNVLIIVFGNGVLQRAISTAESRLSGIAAALFLIAAGTCGIALQLFFPQDAGGAQIPVTITGILHIVFASFAAFTSMLAMLASALWFRKQPDLIAYVPYTLISFVIMLLSGGFGAGAATNGFSLFGVIERITIGTLLVWIFVIALKLYTLAAHVERPPTTAGTLRGAAGH